MRFLYPDFKTKALTFSYDDGCIQDRRLTALLRDYGMKGTFNLCNAWFGNVSEFDHGGFWVHFEQIAREEAPALYAGHEVASHNLAHKPVHALNKEAKDQLSENSAALSELMGYPVRGFAFPCGPFDHTSPDTLSSAGLAYARTVRDTYALSVPQDFYFWHPTCHDRDEKLEPIVKSFAGEKDPEELRLLYIWGHSFELDKNDMDRWAKLENNLRIMKDHEEIWYATNIEICDYINATRKSLPADGVFENRSEQTLYLIHRGERIALSPGEKMKL